MTCGLGGEAGKCWVNVLKTRKKKKPRLPEVPRKCLEVKMNWRVDSEWGALLPSAWPVQFLHFKSTA
jgi:hypothetical protein